MDSHGRKTHWAMNQGLQNVWMWSMKLVKSASVGINNEETLIDINISIVIRWLGKMLKQRQSCFTTCFGLLLCQGQKQTQDGDENLVDLEFTDRRRAAACSQHKLEHLGVVKVESSSAVQQRSLLYTLSLRSQIRQGGYSIYKRVKNLYSNKLIQFSCYAKETKLLPQNRQR
jgi:hypothetical protein